MGFWQGKHVVIGISGGIAAYKVPELIRRLREAGAQVTVVVTTAALQFVTKLTLQTLAGAPVHDTLFGPDGTMDHVRLARAADLVLVAPATANLLARMAAGMADDLLTTLLLARRGPVLVAPAMNTAMWEQAATQRNMATLHADGIHVVGPDCGALACGESGTGRMAGVETILESARRILTPRRLHGRRVLITAGPTRERLDPVRYLSNDSSGRMGWAIAQAALRAGAEVCLVHGPVALEPPWGAECIPVVAAEAMYAAAMEHWPACDAAILSAAVADYRPCTRVEEKIRRDGQETRMLELCKNPDILATLARQRTPRQVVIGFAAETQEDEAPVRDKLQRKGCDLLAMNNVMAAGCGFGGESNRLTLLYRDGRSDRWPLCSKEQCAEGLIDVLATMLEETS